MIELPKPGPGVFIITQASTGKQLVTSSNNMWNHAKNVRGSLRRGYFYARKLQIAYFESDDSDFDLEVVYKGLNHRKRAEALKRKLQPAFNTLDKSGVEQLGWKGLKILLPLVKKKGMSDHAIYLKTGYIPYQVRRFRLTLRNGTRTSYRFPYRGDVTAAV